MHHEAKGLFATHLFDGEPLGLGQAKDAIPYAPPVTGGDTSSGSKAPAAGGDAKAPVPFAPPMTSYVPATTVYDPAAYPTEQTSFNWVPVAMIGGGSLLAIGVFVLLTSGKKAAPTPNRGGKKKRAKKRARRRVRRNIGHVTSGARVHGSRGTGTVVEVHGENASVRWDSGGTPKWVRRSSLHRA